MSTDTPVAGVEATEPVETKSTTPEAAPAKETKETSTEATQEEADKEILEDLTKEDKKKAKEEPIPGENEEEEKPESKEKSDEAKPETPEDKAAEHAKGAEARKEQLQAEIRELVSKRKEAVRAYEEAISKAYRTETVEELEEKGLSPEQAENELLRQQMAMKEFNREVSDLNNTLNIEALQVMQDFPVFDPGTEENPNPLYDKDLSIRVRELYTRAAQPQVDEKTGLVTKSNLTPYEFYKAFAETHESSAEKSRVLGQIEGQKAADKELAAAEVQSSAAPKTNKEDAFLKGLLSSDD